MGETAQKRQAEQRIREALEVLDELGFPRQQRNERSALTLLSLLGLRPNDTWQRASAPLMGITPMMEFFAEHYGKTYAPNTRETVRRQTVHQFVQAALVVPNPDKPSRPTNSPRTVYQIEPSALKLFREFGKKAWAKHLAEYRRSRYTLKSMYARELKDLFAGSRAGLVYVTAFPDRQTMMRYVKEISWETEVWIADSPTHLIHFNGERFLGPYQE